MWESLSKYQKEEYKRMILAYAGLTEVFAQKADSDSNSNKNDKCPVPIINSKYQETIFQRVFNASAEDIRNDPYDAALHLKTPDDTGKKYLIGIKTFGLGSGMQKIMQFKRQNDAWSFIINKIKDNSLDEQKNRKEKDKIDDINNQLYKELACEIAHLRNKKIRSQEAEIKGFSIDFKKDDVERVYHVLMPALNEGVPEIKVGETSYDQIDESNIQIQGCTQKDKPTNFNFTDGKHNYRFTAADHQLLMDFDNKNIIQETWTVKYADDAFAIFSDIFDKIYGKTETKSADTADSGAAPGIPISPSEKTEETVPVEVLHRSAGEHITDTFSWKIVNKNNEVERYSGFNAFYGLGSKISLNERNSKIDSVFSEFKDTIPPIQLKVIKNLLEIYIVDKAPKAEDKIKKEELRDRIRELALQADNEEFYKEVIKLLYRPADEMYIPIPDSRNFHLKNPDFFANGVGCFKDGEKKLPLEKEKCVFKLVFEPSGDSIMAFITQDNGKAIESLEKQTYLGAWIRNGVFQLDEYQPLTAEHLNEIGINAIRLYRKKEDDAVHLKFIWIDDDNYPDDYVGYRNG